MNIYVDWNAGPDDEGDDLGPLADALHRVYPVTGDPHGHLELLADTPSAPTEDDGEQPPGPR